MENLLTEQWARVYKETQDWRLFSYFAIWICFLLHLFVSTFTHSISEAYSNKKKREREKKGVCVCGKPPTIFSTSHTVQQWNLCIFVFIMLGDSIARGKGLNLLSSWFSGESVGPLFIFFTCSWTGHDMGWVLRVSYQFNYTRILQKMRRSTLLMRNADLYEDINSTEEPASLLSNQTGQESWSGDASLGLGTLCSIYAAYASIISMGLLGNVILVKVFFKIKSLQTVPNIFITSLAFGDLLLLLTCVPVDAACYIVDTWLFGQIGCKLLSFIQRTSVGVSVFTLTVLSADRWVLSVSLLMKAL